MTPMLVRDGKLLCSVWHDHARVFEGGATTAGSHLDHALPGAFRIKRYRAGGSGPATAAGQRPGVSLSRGIPKRGHGDDRGLKR